MTPFFAAAQRATPRSQEIGVVTRDEYSATGMTLVRSGLPFVVRNYASELVASTATPTLLQMLGDISMKARRNGSAAAYATQREYIDIRMSSYLDAILGVEVNFPYYAANCPIAPECLDTLGIEIPTAPPGYVFRNPNLWIGAAGNTTPLHKDSTDNFAVHLTGTKRWSLFSILDSSAMYYRRTPYGSYANPAMDFVVSQVDPENVDSGEFPLFGHCKMLQVDCVAGDLLFVPFGWAHAVRNVTPAIMVNLWFALDGYRPLVLSEQTLP